MLDIENSYVRLSESGHPYLHFTGVIPLALYNVIAQKGMNLMINTIGLSACGSINAALKLKGADTIEKQIQVGLTNIVSQYDGIPGWTSLLQNEVDSLTIKFGMLPLAIH